jgi:hypothetical protein
MKIPQIVFQTSPRWFVITKPPGWAMAARVSHSQPSIERFLSPILEIEKLFFPMEMDSRISAIAIVCTDRGTQAQFEKFKQLGLIQCTYQVGLECACKDIDTTKIPAGVQIACSDTSNNLAEVKTTNPLTTSRMNETLSGRLRDSDVNLFRLVFPDPLNPKSPEHLVIEHL